MIKQAGAVLCQAQIKLELELSFSSLQICCIKLKTRENLLATFTATNDYHH